MRLRPLRAADLPSLAAWLPQLAEELGCERWASEHALRVALGRDDTLVGGDCESVLVYKTQTPAPDAARVRLLAVPPDARRLGRGGRTALALERRLARSAKRIYVLVPARAGLALYFWLRLGYRPLTQAKWPAPLEGEAAVWMARELR